MTSRWLVASTVTPGEPPTEQKPTQVQKHDPRPPPPSGVLPVHVRSTAFSGLETLHQEPFFEESIQDSAGPQSSLPPLPLALRVSAHSPGGHMSQAMQGHDPPSTGPAQRWRSGAQGPPLTDGGRELPLSFSV
ncbi:hypothetical protein H1C71_032665 [Ictidomys tridecemlineatus]|nr:hypothetical protein H1C71_032665 [Ictidomys tridecemlineatus]